jgi:hypothetical protein
MGYCTYGGKLVPGNTQASCIGGGGNWVGGETGPDTQVSMPPIGSPIQLPNIGRPPIRPEPDRGIPGYRAPQISQSPERMWDNTDDFGNRINTNFAGYSRRDADNQREDILNNLGAKRVNFGSKTPTNTNPGFFESAKMRTNALNNPPKDSMGLFGDKPTIPYTEGDSIFGAGSITDPVTGEDIKMTGTTEEPLEDKTMDLIMVGYYPAKVGSKIVQTAYKMLATPKGILLSGYGVDKYFDNKEKADAWIAKQTDMVSAKASSMVKPDKGETPEVPPTDTGTTTTATTTNTTTTNAGKNNIFGDGTPSGPSVINAAKTGNISTGLLDKMGTKDFWMTGIEGGSGSWDNRLFRLGEMMSYMGKHPSKQGDSPAKRWTTANTAANTLKASANKAKKTPTPLKIDNIGSYITKKMEDDVGSGFFNWNGMSAAEIKAATAIINTNITKQVRVAEGVEGEGEIDIKMIADEEIAKYLKSIGQI